MERVLAVGRRPLARTHPKLAELVVADFEDYSDVEPELTDFDDDLNNGSAQR